MLEYLSKLSFPKYVNRYLVVGCIYLAFMFGIFSNIAAGSNSGFGIYSVVVFAVTFVPHAVFLYYSGLERGRAEGRLWKENGDGRGEVTGEAVCQD